MSEKKPNIILVCVDQWRGDALSIDNHPVVSTPFLDDLALEGVRCSAAYSSCPSCIAARAGLLTGMSQENHGRIGFQDGIAWDYPHTLAEELGKGGYQTQAVGKMHVDPERNRVGFDNVVLHDGHIPFSYTGGKARLGLTDDYQPWLERELGHPAALTDLGLHPNGWQARPWPLEERLHPTAFVAEQSIEFLRQRDPTNPFFLFMSFVRPHQPFDPPAWAFEQYYNREMPEPPHGNWSHDIYGDNGFGLHEPRRSWANLGDIGADNLQRARAGYYGNMTFIDHQIHRFLWALMESGQYWNSIILFVSDHGEMMGDHDLFMKCYPYEGSARVPLIFRAPPWFGVQKNAVLDQVIELRDIMPTLLDAVDLPIPETCDGKSFFAHAKGETDEPLREVLHGEHEFVGQAIHWLRGETEKYVWFSGDGREQLFDLNADPDERRDLVIEPTEASPERLKFWREKMIETLNDREEGFVQNGKLIAGQKVYKHRAALREKNEKAK